MRLSLWTNLAQPFAAVLDVTRHAEATGWDGLFVADHFMGDGGGFGAVETPMLEATATLAALATATDRLRLGSLVLSATYRHPAVLAAWASTVDHASDGRLLLGVGAGWQQNEHEQYGLALGTPGERVARFDEYCTALHGLLRTPTTTLDGRYFQLCDAINEPKPVQDPLPLLIGGKGDRMLDLVARHADEWNHWSTPDTYPERAGVLDAACERLGRDPATIARSTQALVFLTNDRARAEQFVAGAAPRAAVAGPADVFAEAVATWADHGVDEVIVPDFVLGAGDRRADALDALHAAVAELGG